MKTQNLGGRGGNALIEFSLLGLPIIFITISIVAMGLNMWEFHNLAYSTESTARYISMHGYNCTQNGNSCKLYIQNYAQFFESQGLALDPSLVKVVFTDGSGSTTCNPVKNCATSSPANNVYFPASGYDSMGSDITVTATYLLKNPIALYWPPDTDRSSDFTVGAISKQRIMF